MAVYSMTGYASAQSRGAGDGSGPRIGLEIRSVNGRFLDLAMRLPDDWRQAEPALRELVTRRVRRGKVELRLSVDDGADHLTVPDGALLMRLAAAQQQIRAHLPDVRALSVAEVMRLGGTAAPRLEDPQGVVVGLATQALDELTAARAREGARLAQMLRERLDALRALATRAAPLVPQLVEQQRQRFLERWNDALSQAGDSVAPAAAAERALAEATAFALRIDVSEELTRLASHLEEIARLLDGGGEIGKRLDFLIQELHREANTLGSKSATLELTRISVDMKVLIEQMREQVQNIE